LFIQAGFFYGLSLLKSGVGLSAKSLVPNSAFVGVTLSRGRKLFIAGILKIDDYNELKKENQVSTKNLKKEARDIVVKLKAIDKKNQVEEKALVEIFQRFSEFDVSDKRHLVNLIPPTDIDFKTGALSLNVNQAFLKILSKKVTEKPIKKMNFIEKNVSVEKAVIILSKNGIQVDEKEAKIILELLYLVSKNYDKTKEKKILYP
jgi:site-specific DNA recombinase